VVDVSDPAAPVELVIGMGGAAGAWSASFDVPDGDAQRRLWAFTAAS